MSTSLNVITSRPCFARDYELGRSAAMRDLERSVLGCDYGGTSWTTRREAGRIAELLGLRPGVRLLDVRAGAGWPGLYLAQLTGCDVVLADLPVVGLQIALSAPRPTASRSDARLWWQTAPRCLLETISFDALSHADVLCCMPAKLSMLQACRRVASRRRQDGVFRYRAGAFSVSIRTSDRGRVRPGVCRC